MNFINGGIKNHLRRALDFDPVSNKNVSRNDLTFNGFKLGLHCYF